MYRFSIKLNDSSIAFAVAELKDRRCANVIYAGVRVFDDGRDPMTREPKQVERRTLRQARVNRKRKQLRKKALMRFLKTKGLTPDFSLNHYRLRVEGLDRKLESRELGTVLWFLNARRGQKHSRLSEGDKDSIQDNSAVNIESVMKSEGLRTLGEYFWKKLSHYEIAGKDVTIWKESPLSKNGYNPYLLRNLYEDEFEAIRTAQKEHSDLSEQEWENIKNIIFFQRPVSAPPKGYCRLYGAEKLERADAGLPSAQRFNLLNTIYHLKIVGSERVITFDERKSIYDLLSHQKTVTFKKLRKLLKLEEDEFLKMKDSERDRIEGLAICCLLREEKYFDRSWDDFSYETQDEIVKVLLNAKDESEIVQYVGKYDLSKAQILNISKIKPSSLKRGDAFLSEKALKEILPLMEKGMNYDQALRSLGFVESDPTTLLDALPYYGYLIPEAICHPGTKYHAKDERENGTINNISLHIGLNQLRKIINALIKIYGRPNEIVVEISKDLKMSATARKKFFKRKKQEKELNEEIYKELKKMSDDGFDVNYLRDKEKFQLWHELGAIKQCVLTGKTISQESLLNDEFVVEHILPLDVTLDDTLSNKMLCCREAAIYKGERAPFEAFINSNSNYSYNEILKRARKLPEHKSCRFERDAMEMFVDKNQFINKHLNNMNQYFGRITAKYLRYVCKKVRVSSGRFTKKAARNFGLSGIFNEFINNENKSFIETKLKNRKILKEEHTVENLHKHIENKDDYRSNSVDAIAIALLDHETLESAMMTCKRTGKKRILFECPMELDVLKRQFLNIVSKMIVSHRQDHNQFGRMQDDTIYSLVRDELNKRIGFNIGVRKPITSISSLKNIYSVCSPTIKKALYKLSKDIDFGDKKGDKKNEAAIQQFNFLLSIYSKETGIKRLKMMKKYNGEIFQRKNGFVIPDDVHHVDFWLLREGTIFSQSVSKLALRIKKQERPSPVAKFIMKLHKGDTISVEDAICVVTSIKPSDSNKVIVYKKHYANNTSYGGCFYFDSLLEKNVKKINVDVIGRII